MDALDLVAEHLDPHRAVFGAGDNLNDIAPHPEAAPLQLEIVAAIVAIDQRAQDIVALHPIAQAQGNLVLVVFARGADAVNAGDRSDDNHVAALQKRTDRLESQAVDLLVELNFLLNIGVGARLVGLGLVIVVVADEILDRIVGKKALEFAVELGGEGLVVRDDQRRHLQLLDDIGHGKGLAAPRDT